MKYDAFISYSQSKDRTIAEGIQRTVQKLGKPWWRRRSLRLFRDDASLSASTSLWSSISKNLDVSRNLIIFLSPEAASSKWVLKEVDYWLSTNSLDSILLCLTAGEIVWDDKARNFSKSSNECLPLPLQNRYSSEPLWIDLREYRNRTIREMVRDDKFLSSAATLTSSITGRSKDDILSREVRTQRQAVTAAVSAASLILLLMIGAVWQYFEADAARNLAEKNERLAVAQRDQALKHQSRTLSQMVHAKLDAASLLGETSKVEINQNALLLAIEALANVENSEPRPYTAQAHSALIAALSAKQPISNLPAIGAVSWAFASAGKVLITLSESGEIAVRDATDFGELIVAEEKWPDAYYLGASNDGEYFFIVNGSEIVVFMSADLSKVFEIKVDDDRLEAVEIYGENGAVVLEIGTWDGLSIYRFEIGSDAPITVQDSPHWRHLATDPSGVFAMFWPSNGQWPNSILKNLNTDRIVAEFEGLYPGMFAWHPAKSELALYTGSGEIHIYDALSGAITLSAEVSDVGLPFSVATASQQKGQTVSYSLDGTKLYAISGSTITVFDSGTLEPVGSISSGGDYSDVWLSGFVVSHTGRYIVGTRYAEGYHDDDPTVSETFIWDSDTLEQLLRIPETFNYQASLEVGEDDSYLVSIGGSVWSLQRAKMNADLTQASSAGKVLSIAPNSALYIARDEDGLTSLRQMKDHTAVSKLNVEFSPQSEHFLSPRGNLLLGYVGPRNEPVIIETRSEGALFNFAKHPKIEDIGILTVSFLEQKQAVILSLKNGEIYWFDLDGSDRLELLIELDEPAIALATSDAAEQVFSMSEGGEVTAIDVQNKSVVWSAQAPTAPLNTNQRVAIISDYLMPYHLEVSIDGRFLMAGTGAQVGLFEFASGEWRGSYGAGVCPLTSAQFEHLSGSLLLGSNDLLANIITLEVNGSIEDSAEAISIGARLTGSPVDLCSAEHDRKIFASDEGDLYILDKNGLRLLLGNATDVEKLVQTGIRQAYRCLTQTERAEAFLEPGNSSWCDEISSGRN